MSTVEPMILELVDGTDGSEHGTMNVYVEHRKDGSALLLGELRFGVVGFVSEATWTLRHAWQDRTDVELAFRLAQVKELDPLSVVLIKSVEFDRGSIVPKGVSDEETD